MTVSERLYRLCLRAYPAPYRADRGEEILATLAEAHEGRRLPVPGEVLALLRAGLAERNRSDLSGGGARWMWRGLAGLAIPLACVNAAVALAGLRVAWSLPGGPGRWWPAFALVAVALAVAAAARLPGPAALLGLTSFGFVAFDAVTMATASGATPHLRLLEHGGGGPGGGIFGFRDPSASVPSNPTEVLPFAAVLALAGLALRFAGGGRPPPRAAVLPVALVLGTATALAGVALADPARRFAVLLVPALAVALVTLAAGLVYARAAVVAVAVLVASAPSAYWFSSARLRIEQGSERGVLYESATRDAVPGLLAGGALLAAALLAAALAHRAARRHASPSR